MTLKNKAKVAGFTAVGALVGYTVATGNALLAIVNIPFTVVRVAKGTYNLAKEAYK